MHVYQWGGELADLRALCRRMITLLLIVLDLPPAYSFNSVTKFQIPEINTKVTSLSTFFTDKLLRITAMPLYPKSSFGRSPRAKWSLSLYSITFWVELAIQLLAFALFANAYPNRYRDVLWLSGGIQGFNSDPTLRIYFYANHREPPNIPWIWTQRFMNIPNIPVCSK